MTDWVLFDYGVGNLHSLRQALLRAGATASVTDDPHQLAEADVAVLPGVGAFGHVMDSLAPAAQALRERHTDGRPILGVCIGMQAFYEGSEEDPGISGLGLLDGTVQRLPEHAGKIPHMGWNTLQGIDDPELQELEGAHVYYVHSYAAPVGSSTICTSTYGTSFSAGVRSHNTVGFQFHPEKSGQVGAAILKRTVRVLEDAA